MVADCGLVPHMETGVRDEFFRMGWNNFYYGRVVCWIDVCF